MALHLTPNGLALLQSALAGEADIVFTAIQLGSGSDAGASAASLNSVKMTLPLSAIQEGEDFVTLTAAYNNAAVNTAYHATELGVLAQDPANEGQTLLYAYCYTETAKAEYIPSKTERAQEGVIAALLYVGEAENVTAEISESLQYVTLTVFSQTVQGLQTRPKLLRVTVPAISAGGTQTVTATGVTSSNTVDCSPDATDGASWEIWRNCGVRCSAQGANALTFRAESATGAAITVNVKIWD